MTSTESTEVKELILGYITKEKAYSLSTILDNPNVFTVSAKEYDQAENTIKIEFRLNDHVLRD